MSDEESSSLSALTQVPWRKRIANSLFPGYSLLLDQINNNALVRKWINEHADVPVVAGRSDLYSLIENRYIKGEAITYLEFGVYEGASIKSWSAVNSNPESRFIGFDSFVGLPEDWNASMKRGTFDVSGAIPEVGDHRVSFVDGWFQHTLPKFLETFRNERRLIINNDCDLYSSTAYCLAKLDTFLLPGTIIIFDEFSSALNEFRAWNDYLRAFMRKVRPIALTANYAERAAFIFE